MKNGAHQQPSKVIFAVMGATGTGKSTFIHLLTNDDKIHIGHDPESETLDVQTADYVDTPTGRHVMLIDTPGFDDSREGITDTDILQRIVDYLEPESGKRRKLNGIIYMQRISDPRVGGLSRKNLRMFHSLCGEKNLGSVRIVTTNWSRVTEQEGSQREAGLKNVAFRALIDAGAQMRRHANTLESARRIMSELIPLESVTMKIQEEMQAGKKLAETDAGMVLTAEMRVLQRKHEQEMANLKKELEAAARESNEALRAELELERKELAGKLERMEVDQTKLEQTLQELREAERKRREEEKAERQRLIDQAAEDRHVMKALINSANERERRTREQLEQQIEEANDRIRVFEKRSSGSSCVIC